MLFLQQLRGELRKLFARPRTWMGYGAFLVMEAVILFVYKLDKVQKYNKGIVERNGLEFSTYYSSLTITFTIMLLSMFVLGSVYFALVAGDIVAKENEDGNLRLVFARPISRLRLLLVKYAAICLYTFSFVFFVGISGYLMAVAAIGWQGGLFVMEPKMKVFAAFPEWSEGAFRLGALRDGHRAEHDHAVVDRVHVLVFPHQAGGGHDHHAEHPLRGHDFAEFPLLQTLRILVRDLADERLGVSGGAANLVGQDRGVLRVFGWPEHHPVRHRLAGIPDARFQNMSSAATFFVFSVTFRPNRGLQW
jgi:hypothetical protein